MFFVFKQPVAIVLPHHNIVADIRQNFLKNMAQKRLITRHIVLLSPDHFGANQNQITSSSRNWDLSTGTALYGNFLKLNLTQNDYLLQNDHGLFNPLADLVKAFPYADFYPVLIGQKTTPQELQTLLLHLEKYCGFDCLLVASVDFSHYLPATLATVHDAYTINNLQNLDIDNLLRSEVDSPQSLYLLATFARYKNAHKWSLFDHTNLGVITHNPDIETTTHIFGSYSYGSPVLGTSLSIIHLPRRLDRAKNQSTLGDRFFYGVDKFVVDSHVPNFVIGQITTSSGTLKNFLPITPNNLFITGPTKQLLIQQYFDTISDPTIVKDYFWGTLFYERKNKSNPS
ncbi:MAG: AmmeMemoRadiSam system protein B [Microgenomates group bacterium]